MFCVANFEKKIRKIIKLKFKYFDKFFGDLLEKKTLKI
jgi:hypothetical protein